ncbi:MAG: methyltransferase family protein [Xanthobacteraceae bacterium]
MSYLDQGQAARQSRSARKGVLLTAIVTSIALLVVSDSSWSDSHFLHETIEWCGIALIVVCIVGRTWCTLYIGGRKNHSLVTDGPYSISRNPLYLLSIVGAVGVGAQVGSMAIALVAGFIAWVVFVRTAMIEEASLQTIFGASYRRYLAEVPRFLPRPSLWQDRVTVQVQPKLVVTTFTDALVFLLAIPVAEGFEYLHAAGVLPTYFTVP